MKEDHENRILCSVSIKRRYSDGWTDKWMDEIFSGTPVKIFHCERMKWKRIIKYKRNYKKIDVYFIDNLGVELTKNTGNWKHKLLLIVCISKNFTIYLPTMTQRPSFLKGGVRCSHLHFIAILSFSSANILCVYRNPTDKVHIPPQWPWGP